MKKLFLILAIALLTCSLAVFIYVCSTDGEYDYSRTITLDAPAVSV